MTTVFYHRTMIAEARSIVTKGFVDEDWDFGLRDVQTGEDALVTGVWLADRPLGRDENIPGDAVVEVTADLTEQELADFELAGMLWDARLWVAPAELINSRSKMRILEVDPRTSWFHDAINEEEEPGT
jgi:hypothetical protein